LRCLRTLLIAFLTAALREPVTATPIDCAYDPARTHLSRIIAADSSGGPIYGAIAGAADKSRMRTLALRDHEIVLTFDDGPAAASTHAILDTLERHCVKATFFAVGRMAIPGSKTLHDVALKGHTIGSHTWSHPRSMRSMRFEDIKAEIEMGFAAVSEAAGEPIAPFFRFPGLADTPEAAAYLASRNISIWSADVVSGDVEPGATPAKISQKTVDRLERLGKGIILFHDTKRATAAALDGILTSLENRGYRVVHIVSNTAYQPDPELSANPQIFRSMGVDAVGTGRRITPEPRQLLEGLVTVLHNEWIDLGSVNTPMNAKAAQLPTSSRTP
jgi:peptidoglycan-N-acetylglucosamine deacetylase